MPVQYNQRKTFRHVDVVLVAAKKSESVKCNSNVS